MRHGSVYQRHLRSCPAAVDGIRPTHRCKGYWAYALEHGRDSTGRRLQVTKGGFPTRTAAQQALQDVSRTLLSDVDITSTTVGEYLDTWITGKHALRPKTLALYRDIIDHYLAPGVGSVRLLDLRAHHLDRFYAATTTGRRGTPLSPSTIRRIHAVLRSALNSAVRRRLIPYNPADHIELAPENPKRPRPWTSAQSRQFLASAADDRLFALYRLLLATGMRRGEAVGLRWEDVDLDRHALHVTQQITEVRGRAVTGAPKTRRGVRLVPLDDPTVQALRRHAAQQEAETSAWGEGWHATGLVFTREDGRALRPEYVTRHFQSLAARAGLPVIRLHDLRHTNASLALKAGVALKVVSERLGHSQTSITADLYTHVEETVSRDAAQRIGDVLADDASSAS